MWLDGRGLGLEALSADDTARHDTFLCDVHGSSLSSSVLVRALKPIVMSDVPRRVLLDTPTAREHVKAEGMRVGLHDVSGVITSALPFPRGFIVHVAMYPTSGALDAFGRDR
jgi:hypothetical protein